MKLCPGSKAIPVTFSDSERNWCHFCGRTLPMRRDGSLQSHAMRYEDFLERMADEVEHVIGDRWSFGSAIR